MDILSLTRATQRDGCTVHILPHHTLLMRGVIQKMRDEYADDKLPDGPAGFAVAMPLILGIDLPNDPPLWGQIVKGLLESRQHLIDPVACWKTLEEVAPANFADILFDLYLATRPAELLAQGGLRQGSPSPETGDDTPDAGDADPNA